MGRGSKNPGLWIVFTISIAYIALLPHSLTFAAPAADIAAASATGPSTALAELPPADVAPVPAEIPVALLVDLSSHQILFAREAGRRFMPASVTKVMTAYTAIKLIAQGKLKPSRQVEISKELADKWSGEGSSMYLLAGERPTIEQLLLGATTVSGNDATVAIGTAVTGSVAGWTALMNANAADLGMDQSYFGSPNGFPDEGHTFSTAHDLALLGEALVTRYPELYHHYIGHRTMTWRGFTQTNHDPVTGRVIGADGMKTGFTNEAGYTFLGTAERDGRRLIVVLAGAPNHQLRDAAARQLLEWGFARFGSRPIFPPGTIVGSARVQEGTVRSVALRTPVEIGVTSPAGRHLVPKLSILYRGPLEAPIAKGEAVARLRVETPGLRPVEIPLHAAEEVPKAGPLHRLINGLAAMLP